MALTFEDKMEIHELIAKYANSFDNGKFEEWLDTWAEEGIWQGGPGTFSGKSELAKLIEILGGSLQDKRRIMTNVVVSGDEKKATAECYMLVIERKASTEIRATSFYTDTLKKIDGSWKFVSRIVTMDPNCIPKM